MSKQTLEERIATAVLEKFHALPKSSKPRAFPDGSQEWTPISGVVLAINGSSSGGDLKCIAVASGSKCLPQSALPLCDGQVLHDCHAEILALRGLNYFLVSEILRLLRCVDNASQGSSLYVRRCVDMDSTKAYFELDPDVSVHMFSTEAPCGDASMEVLMADKPIDAREPWTSDREPGVLQGRSYFQDLGVLRRKPSRPDAPPTMSKSCTDKLSLRQVTSLLSFPACLFVVPSANTYLSLFVLPQPRFSETACARAFGPSGRMQPLSVRSTGCEHQYRPFHVKTVPISSVDIPYSRPCTGKVKVGNVSALWIAGPNGLGTAVNESLINGVKQGYRQFSKDTRRCSAVSRYQMVNMTCEVMSALDEDDYRALCMHAIDEHKTISYGSYKDMLSAFKVPGKRTAKAAVSEALKGWPMNIGDHDWKLTT